MIAVRRARGAASGPLRRRPLRRLFGASAALAVAALLVGCVSIPTGGAVTEHTLRSDQGEPDVNFIASPPRKGASQEEILRDFVRAGVGSQDGYSVARKFLTDDFAPKWNPNAAVLVTDGSRGDTVRTDAAAMSLTVRVTGRVDATGQYTTPSAVTTTTQPYRFTRVSGQWRISDAPDGTIVTPTTFSTIFSSYPLYFFDPSAQYLVPDVRWFANGTSSTASRIVRMLLAGPATWLAGGATVSAFPSGTQLGNGAVTIDAGRATVDLSNQVLTESATAKRRMTAQLQASLAALGTLSSVALTVDGLPVEQSGTDDSPAVVDPQVGSAPVAYRDGTFGLLSGGTLRPIASLSPKISVLQPLSATIDRAQSVVAVLDAQGVHRVTASGDPALVDARTGLATPTIDPFGFVWSAPRNDPGALRVFDPKAVAHAVASATPAPSGSSIVAMKLSRDGARLALALSTPDGPSLVVAAVLRDQSLVPTGLGPAVPIALPAGVVLADVAWADDVTLAVLLRDTDSSQVRAIQVGGLGTQLSAPESGRQIVGGNGGLDGLSLVADDGSVLQQSGAGWQATSADVSFLVTQQ